MVLKLFCAVLLPSLALPHYWSDIVCMLRFYVGIRDLRGRSKQHLDGGADGLRQYLEIKDFLRLWSENQLLSDLQGYDGRAERRLLCVLRNED